jgi:hypothetical protein
MAVVPTREEALVHQPSKQNRRAGYTPIQEMVVNRCDEVEHPAIFKGD